MSDWNKSKETLIDQIVNDDFMNGFLEAFIFCEEEQLNEEYAEWCKDNGLKNSGWGIYDLTRDCLDELIGECLTFQRMCREAKIDLYDYGESQAGHDFYLTRNHVGTGFNDNPHEDSETLTRIATSFAMLSAGVTEDGEIVME
jgi:hypothetical protein